MISLLYEDIERKIKLLERGITLCLIRSGSGLCVNRKRRVAELKKELELRQQITKEELYD